jgi:hypothetical protein
MDNPIFVAVATLKTTEDIRKFVHDYEKQMVKHDETIRGREHEILCAKLDYMLNYCNEEDVKIWRSALSDMISDGKCYLI